MTATVSPSQITVRARARRGAARGLVVARQVGPQLATRLKQTGLRRNRSCPRLTGRGRWASDGPPALMSSAAGIAEHSSDSSRTGADTATTAHSASTPGTSTATSPGTVPPSAERRWRQSATSSAPRASTSSSIVACRADSSGTIGSRRMTTSTCCCRCRSFSRESRIEAGSRDPRPPAPEALAPSRVRRPGLCRLS